MALLKIVLKDILSLTGVLSKAYFSFSKKKPSVSLKGEPHVADMQNPNLLKANHLSLEGELPVSGR
jgi:hypothetical protein